MEVSDTNAEGKEPTIPVKDRARATERVKPVFKKQKSSEE